MAVPVITAVPLTTAMAKVLKSRTRAVIAAGATYAADDATVTVTPTPPLVAILGGGTVVPYALATVTVTQLDTAGTYTCRSETPGQASQLWSTPVTTTGTGPYTATFTNVPVTVGTGSVIAVAPSSLVGYIVWRSAPFNTVPVLGMSTTAGVDPLDVTLVMVKNDASTTQVIVDWGDLTAPVTDTIANWVAGKAYSYAHPGPYTIQATAKDAGNLTRGVAMLAISLAGVYLTPTMDGSVAKRAHLAIKPSTRAPFTTGNISWGDGNGTTTGASTTDLTDIPHDYLLAGTYQISFNGNTGVHALATLVVP